MSVTIYSRPIPNDVKDKIIGDNFVKLLEDCNENYIKRDMEMDR